MGGVCVWLWKKNKVRTHPGITLTDHQFAFGENIFQLTNQNIARFTIMVMVESSVG